MARKTRKNGSIRGDKYLRRANVSRRSQNTRKRRPDRIPLPSLWLIVGTALVVAGLTYVSLIARCEALGRDIKAIDADITDRERILQNEQVRWARMKSPENIDRVLAAYGIKMALPRADQVVRVVRDSSAQDMYAALLREQSGDRVQVAATDRRMEIHE